MRTYPDQIVRGFVFKLRVPFVVCFKSCRNRHRNRVYRMMMETALPSILDRSDSQNYDITRSDGTAAKVAAVAGSSNSDNTESNTAEELSPWPKRQRWSRLLLRNKQGHRRRIFRLKRGQKLSPTAAAILSEDANGPAATVTVLFSSTLISDDDDDDENSSVSAEHGDDPKNETAIKEEVTMVVSSRTDLAVIVEEEAGDCHQLSQLAVPPHHAWDNELALLAPTTTSHSTLPVCVTPERNAKEDDDNTGLATTPRTMVVQTSWSVVAPTTPGNDGDRVPTAPIPLPVHAELERSEEGQSMAKSATAATVKPVHQERSTFCSIADNDTGDSVRPNPAVCCWAEPTSRDRQRRRASQHQTDSSSSSISNNPNNPTLLQENASLKLSQLAGTSPWSGLPA